MPESMRRKTVERERLRLLFQQAHASSKVALTGAVVCTAVLLHARPGAGPLLWLAAVTVFTGLRFAVYRRFFRTDIRRHPVGYWLRRHGVSAALTGCAWGTLPLVPVDGTPDIVRDLPVLVPAFVLMAAVSSYGIYLSQYLVLLVSISGTTAAALVWVHGSSALPALLLFTVFVPVLVLTAKRYGNTLSASLAARYQMRGLVEEAKAANAELHRQNSTLAHQQNLIAQEEALARHVFTQLTLGGDHRLPGIHSWTQPMGSLSGDLIQAMHGPDGRSYVLLADFTGHGLPAALGALPASSVFLAMAAKGLPVETIALELNRKLRELLPVGYFCCAVLLELSADRRTAHVWNAGLPPVLIRRRGRADYQRIASHSLPLGVVDGSDFQSEAHRIHLDSGDLLYAYSDGLTEAENIDGEMWGSARLERFLERDDLPTPRLPMLIETVLEHVDRAPASDDISVVEIEATPLADAAADAA